MYLYINDKLINRQIQSVKGTIEPMINSLRHTVSESVCLFFCSSSV